MRSKGISVAVVCVLLAGALGYGIRGRNIARNEQLIMDSVEAHALASLEGTACHAYLHEDPHVGIWALGQAISHLEAQLSRAPENPWLKRHALQLDAMLAHARIGKLYNVLDDRRGEDHVRTALKYASEAYPAETMDRVQLFKFVDRLDAIQRRTEASPVPEGAASLPGGALGGTQ